jgi:hypothetical protein
VAFISDALDWLVGLIDAAPEAVRPGLAVALLVSMIWVLARRRRQLWNWLVRVWARVVDISVGVLLVPELVWTTSRRSVGRRPAGLAILVSRIADRALDAAASAYGSHSRVAPSGRFPWLWVVLPLIVSVGLYWSMTSSLIPGLANGATFAWECWRNFHDWLVL